MKKQKMLISLAGLAVAVATTATVAAYTLAGDGSSAPAGESAGTQEPSFQDDKSTFDQAPDTIDDGKGGVSVTNPDIGGATDGPVSGGQQGTVVNSDDPPAGKVLPDGGKVVPIGTFDGDVGPTDKPVDPPPPVEPPLPEPVDGTQVPGTEPAIGPAIEPIEVGPRPILTKKHVASRLVYKQVNVMEHIVLATDQTLILAARDFNLVAIEHGDILRFIPSGWAQGLNLPSDTGDPRRCVRILLPGGRCTTGNAAALLRPRPL